MRQSEAKNTVLGNLVATRLDGLKPFPERFQHHVFFAISRFVLPL